MNIPVEFVAVMVPEIVYEYVPAVTGVASLMDPVAVEQSGCVSVITGDSGSGLKVIAELDVVALHPLSSITLTS